MATPTKPDLFTPRPGHYPTKRDRRFQLLIWGTALLLIGPTVSLMWRQPGPGWWLGTLLMAVTMMALWTVQSMHYRLETGKLRIVAGPMSREIPLSTIQTVTMVRNGGAAPAMSLDRLEIVWTDEGRTDKILISPLDREAFLSEMGQYDRGLKKVEGGLRRR